MVIEFLKSSPLLLELTRAFVAIILALIFVLVNAIIFIYLERKVWARVMQRMGPTYVGKWGILQLIADLIKVLGKEIIVPAKANKFAFLSLPIFSTGLALALMIIVPFDYIVAHTLAALEPVYSGFGIFKHAVVSNGFSSGLFLIFAILTLNPVFILLIGWISNNKYTVVGGFRAAAQLLSFEIPLLISLASVIILAGTFNLYEVVEKQSKVWFIFLLPLAFILFLITAIAEAERTPFDIPDAESEIIAGWNTEYSATPFMMLIFGMYVRAIISATLISILFFGGWYGPELPGFLKPISGPFWLAVKIYFFMFLLILIRSAYPRYRIDQLLSISWTKLLPLSLINIILVILVKYLSISYGLI